MKRNNSFCLPKRFHGDTFKQVLKTHVKQTQRDNAHKSAEENDIHRLHLAAFEIQMQHVSPRIFIHSGLFEGKKWPEGVRIELIHMFATL